MNKNKVGVRPPLQALLFAPDQGVWNAIFSGKKIITIREGHRDYKENKPVILCCHILGHAVMADVTSVRHCLLKEVMEGEYMADGYGSPEDMLHDLRQYYPNLTEDSPLTVITWENVQGGLINKLWER